jgi:hypothetical protein
MTAQASRSGALAVFAFSLQLSELRLLLLRLLEFDLWLIQLLWLFQLLWLSVL